MYFSPVTTRIFLHGNDMDPHRHFPFSSSALLLGLLGRDPLCYDCLAALHLYGSISRLGQNLYWTLSLFFLVCVIRTRILVHSAVYYLRDLRHIHWPSHSFSRTIGSDSVKAPRPLCCTELLGYAQWQTLFLWFSLELRWRNQPSFYQSLCRCRSEYPNLQNPFLRTRGFRHFGRQSLYVLLGIWVLEANAGLGSPEVGAGKQVGEGMVLMQRFEDIQNLVYKNLPKRGYLLSLRV